MKVVLLNIFLYCILAGCQKKSDLPEGRIRLPITAYHGFGPLRPSFSPIHAEYTLDNENGADWVPTYRPVKGIPLNWRSVEKCMIWIDGRQLVYQNFHEGKISQQMFDDLQKSWKWEPQEGVYSKTPIKCFVYVIKGLDAKNKTALMVDRNNNLDFSDDTPLYPDVVRKIKDTYDKAATNDTRSAVMVEYETFRDGAVHKDSLPLLLKYFPESEPGLQYVYTFPYFGRATLDWDEEKYDILVHNLFNGPNLCDADILASIHGSSEKDLKLGRFITKGEIIEIGGLVSKVKFRHMGIEERTGDLILKGESNDVKDYSLQTGRRLQPFTATEFRTGNPISTNQYKGKYLLIDFWGTWCGPCVEELPELRSIYNEIDKTKIQFISIASDSPLRLRKFLEKTPLEWPQVLSDSSKNLIDTYHITQFPTAVLVDSNGIVIEKNFDAAYLRKKLAPLFVK
jgi:peroxiredoxin